MNSEQNPVTSDGEPTGTLDAAEIPAPVMPSAPTKSQKPPRQPMPWVTYVLMGLCVLIYLLQLFSQSQTNLDLPFIYGGKINQAILAGQFWRFIYEENVKATLGKCSGN